MPLTNASLTLDPVRVHFRNAVADGADVIKIFACKSIRDGGGQTLSDDQINAAGTESEGAGQTGLGARARRLATTKPASGIPWRCHLQDVAPPQGPPRGNARRAGFARSTHPTRPVSHKIPIQNAPVHSGERHQVGRRDMLVDLVHGSVDEAEFHHRAVILNEAGIRGPA
jgi:hypothetical protein